MIRGGDRCLEDDPIAVDEKDRGAREAGGVNQAVAPVDRVIVIEHDRKWEVRNVLRRTGDDRQNFSGFGLNLRSALGQPGEERTTGAAHWAMGEDQR